MNRPRAAVVGVLGFLALVVLAAIWSIPRIERDLTSRADEELAAAGIDDVSIEFEGRNGRVGGPAAATAAGELDELRGARWVHAEPQISTTTTTTTTPPPPSPPELTLTRDGRTVRLEGTIAAEADRLALVDGVVAAGFDVDDALVTDPEIEAFPVDGFVVDGLVPLIGPLLDGSDDGTLALTDGIVVVAGTAFDPVEAEEIEAAIDQAAGAGVTVDNKLTIRVLSEEQQIDALQIEIDQIFELARAIEGQNPGFEVSDEELNPQATEILDRVIVAMRRYPLPSADIIGHTDSQGSDESNQILSETRAQSVLSYLTAAGVDESRLSASGRGESEPLVGNEDENGRNQNRRVDFNVKKSEG